MMSPFPTPIVLRKNAVTIFLRSRIGGKKESHIKTPAAQIATQRRTRDRVKVYPSIAKINFSQFAGDHYIFHQLKR
jgi:hypothetical protein